MTPTPTTIGYWTPAVRGRQGELRVWSVPDPDEVAVPLSVAPGASPGVPPDVPETSTPPPAPVP